MKTLITALAVTATFATSAVAKIERTKHVRNQANSTLSRNALSHNPNQINARWCRFHHPEFDPDPRVRFEVVRDCREWEESESE